MAAVSTQSSSSSEFKYEPFTGALPTSTKQIILVSSPSGPLSLANFKVHNAPLAELKDGQFLVRILYLSVDPYIRSYSLGEKAVGHPVTGQSVGDIIASKAPLWPVGTIVSGVSGATEYHITDGSAVETIERIPWRRVDTSLGLPLSTAVGIAGMTGATAWLALRDFAVMPKGGTTVVSAAAGAVGNAFGQLAKAAGAGKVIGIAGSADKCAALLSRGFDVAINYKTQDIGAALRAAAPDGIDHFFDSVGGAVKVATYLQLKNGASVTTAGGVSAYNGQSVVDFTADEKKLVDSKNLRGGRIVVWTLFEHWNTAITSIGAAIKSGALKYDEHFYNGLESQPQAFIDQLNGLNHGKVVIRVGPTAQINITSSATST